MPDVASSRIKGAAFREFLHWYARDVSERRLMESVARLPKDLCGHLDPDRDYLGTLPSTWYPAPLVHALLDGITAGLSEHERIELADNGARAVMAVTLGGIYKRLMKMLMSPQLYARFAPKVWTSYYDTGDFKVVVEHKSTADTTIANWAAHHPLMCAMNRMAACCVYEAMGLRNVQTARLSCVSHGDPLCRFLTSWS